MANTKFDAKSFNPEAFKYKADPHPPHPPQRNPQEPCAGRQPGHP